MELTYTAWDIVAFANDVWREADEGLRVAIERQWQANVAATGGGHAQAVAPEWVERATDGFPYAPFMWDEERRTQLRADLDGLYGHLYRLTRISRGGSRTAPTNPIPSLSCAVRHVLTLVRDEAAYGEYRTKRMMREAYDRLARSELLGGGG